MASKRSLAAHKCVQQARIGTDFAADACGATAIEYGLLVAAISAAIFGIVFLLGDDVSALFGRISEAFPDASRACEQAHVNCGKGK